MKISLDIEHFLKVKLLNDFSKNNEEDGYSIVKVFFAENPTAFKQIENQKNPFTKNLKEAINGNYAIWNVVELLPFGSFISLLELYYNKYEDKKMSRIISSLYAVKCIRNAAAHNNCLLNTISNKTSVKITPTARVVNLVSKIDSIAETSRNTKMKNAITHDFVALLLIFDEIVTSSKTKQYTYNDLVAFYERLNKHSDYFVKNSDIQSTFIFFKYVIDYFNKNSYNI